ncbi:hypothetical protein SAMN05443633_11225 [Chryseobacterium arachidis]|uniref:Uncharacterized protein n=1 Tax=Chryseobacterium arachidis TaxID=1416778 RepID=A0A1M5I8N1_9FLAO|nr:hypothetical protein [Chryseobacterium arachidis]SHG24153.1 hypothetical protein SAMN05443633_11225 [Chryseobacterium arachidis]
MDHDTIARLIEAEPDTRKKFEIWSKNYEILRCNGRIFTRDTDGKELKRIYCCCENCKKDPQNALHADLFREFYNRSFDELQDELENQKDYGKKLKIWVDRFGIDYCVIYSDPERNKELSIIPQPNSHQEISTYNNMQYRLWKDHHFGPLAKGRVSASDLQSRIKSYNDQLSKSPFADKILEDTKKQLLEQYSTKATPSVKVYFDNLILGKPLDFEEKVLDVPELMNYIEANEAYLFYCYLHKDNMIIKDVFLIHSADVIAETDNGMTWGQIAKFFTMKAVANNVDIPYSDKNFMNLTDSQGKKISNKRVAFVANLKAFNPEQQFQIINELCDTYPAIPGVIALKQQLIVDYKELRQNSPLDENGEMIEEVKGLLSDYPRAEAPYKSAIEKFEKGIYERNALDDLRLSLELLLKEMLSNEKSLENQQGDLKKFLSTKGVSPEIANILWGYIEPMTKYHNKYVKHDDNIGKKDSEMILELTTTILKQIIKASSH